MAGERGWDLSSREQQRPWTDRMDGRRTAQLGTLAPLGPLPELSWLSRSGWQGHLKLIGKEEHDTHFSFTC